MVKQNGDFEKIGFPGFSVNHISQERMVFHRRREGTASALNPSGPILWTNKGEHQPLKLQSRPEFNPYSQKPDQTGK